LGRVENFQSWTEVFGDERGRVGGIGVRGRIWFWNWWEEGCKV